jgi:glycosyltransferase involved in cell wall biosynthesis
MNLSLVVPAYEPPEALEWVADRRVQEAFSQIVVVDDGSSAALQKPFLGLANLPKTQVLRHATNLGKGAALKTGLRAAARTWRSGMANGVVTADADGQHAIEDVLAIAEAFIQTSGPLILGARQLGAGVPWANQFGNRISCLALRTLLGLKLADTQTGLRAIPEALIPELLDSPLNGYDFEMEMLLLAHRRGLPIREIRIQTIYPPGHGSSHFRPIRDTIRVGLAMVRACSRRRARAAARTEAVGRR